MTDWKQRSRLMYFRQRQINLGQEMERKTGKEENKKRLFLSIKARGSVCKPTGSLWLVVYFV